MNPTWFIFGVFFKSDCNTQKHSNIPRFIYYIKIDIEIMGSLIYLHGDSNVTLYTPNAKNIKNNPFWLYQRINKMNRTTLQREIEIKTI